METIRRKFAEFIVNTSYEKLPTEVIQQAKLCMLDYVGVAFAGNDTGLAPIMESIAAQLKGKEESTIIGSGLKVPAYHAALLNAIKGHSLDMDDGHRYASAHPGVVVFPASLALAESESATTKKVVEAIVVGYETMIRVAETINPSHAKRGFHTTGTTGPFGAAAACAKIMGLGVREVENALSIAGLQAAGLLEVTSSGQMMKPLQAGHAAQAGLLAALLASHGCEGPNQIFEGEKGFAHAHSDEAQCQNMVNKLGRPYEIMNTYFKLHATCRGIHASVDAALGICKEHNIAPDQIEEIVIETFPHAINLCGDIIEPDNILAIKFSISFSVAMAIITGDLFVNKFTDENLKDKEIKRLARKVSASIGDEWAKSYPEKRGASVTIRTITGETHIKSIPLAMGAPENPAGLKRLKEKFIVNVTQLIPHKQAEKLLKYIMNLEKQTITSLTGLLF